MKTKIWQKYITAIIRPIQGYGTVECPQLKRDTDELEKAATNMAPTLRDMNYEDRLQKEKSLLWIKVGKGATLIMQYNFGTGKSEVR